MEQDILETVKKVEKSLSNLSQCVTCPVASEEVLDALGEIVEVGAVPLSLGLITTNHLVPLSFDV